MTPDQSAYDACRPPRPKVTVAIPVLNEESSIIDCLQRLRDQTISDIEILVADGGSTDATRRLVTEVAEGDHRVKLLDNPRRIQAAGLNECLARARSTRFVRMDGHAFVEHDYLQRSLEALESSGAQVVGGRMIPVPASGLMPAAIAAANSSRWGAGPARFHRGETAGPAETVYLGTVWTDTARAVGGWSEDVGVNEDYEFNHRIRAGGGVVWFDPSIRVYYRPRSTLRAVTHQYYRYGASKAIVMTRHPASIRLRQLAPLILLPALTAGATRRRRSGVACRLIVGAHVALVVRGASRLDEPIRVRALAACTAVAMHYAWSIGVWTGLIRTPAALRPSTHQVLAQGFDS